MTATAASNLSTRRPDAWFPRIHLPEPAPLFRVTTSMVTRLVDIGCESFKRNMERNSANLRALAEVRSLPGLFEQQQSYVSALLKDQTETLKAVSQVLQQGYDQAREMLSGDQEPAVATRATKSVSARRRAPAALQAVPAPPPAARKASPSEAVFELYRDKAGEYRFRLKAADGSVLLKSEGYKTRASAANGVASVQKNSSNDGRYEAHVSSSGKPTFTLKAGNNRVIGSSPTFSSDDEMRAAMSLVRHAAASSPVKDQTEAA